LSVIWLVLCAVPARGQAIVDQWDAQLWLQWNSQIPVADTWGLILEAQPRWNENFTHYDQVVLRAGVLKRITPTVQVSAAYAFVPRHTIIGTLYEQQAYEQLLFVLPRLGKWASQARVREDQRYLGQWGELSHRVREQFKIAHPIAASPAWSLVLHQELFVNWNDTRLGPSAGLDQHRLFMGVNHPVTGAIAIEAGYMWQEVFRLGARPERHNHIAMLQFQFRPRRGGASPPPAAPLTPVSAPNSTNE
jgi:hypothetical protein